MPAHTNDLEFEFAADQLLTAVGARLTSYRSFADNASLDLFSFLLSGAGATLDFSKFIPDDIILLILLCIGIVHSLWC